MQNDTSSIGIVYSETVLFFSKNGGSIPQFSIVEDSRINSSYRDLRNRTNEHWISIRSKFAPPFLMLHRVVFPPECYSRQHGIFLLSGTLSAGISTQYVIRLAVHVGASKLQLVYTEIKACYHKQNGAFSHQFSTKWLNTCLFPNESRYPSTGMQC